ncbi:lysosomal acid lipase/cholesteryl ester hydrolase-like [Chelonus insularis]|uniref:lysosomal acid lipase/cholesteryl ester hydrolase-like n=1 Tax=Chelonus insularis TaxID=460826 RepID=UPI0015883BEE|nr:lysosomal acid lipase/cholesteryl ester hydrolase-like [Chelonus insularis]
MSLVYIFVFLLYFHHVLTILITNKIEETDNNYNPDVHLTTPEMIKRAGYPAEAHIIETTDGYLLCIHRIPGKFNSRPVFLQHGLLGSSADWVISGKQKSLGNTTRHSYYVNAQTEKRDQYMVEPRKE